MDIEHVDTLYLPPTMNRAGNTKAPNDTKYIHTIKNHMFAHPVIMISDAHSHTQAVINYLMIHYDLSKYIIITVGDMAGELIYGSDGVPTEFYKQFLEHSHRFYFVQGNHDLPDENKECNKLKNKDGSLCMVHGKVFNTPIGRIGGINGIVSSRKKAHPYKIHEEKYLGYLDIYGKHRLDVLLIHDTPQHSDKVIGKPEIWDRVKKIKPRVCIYGHCHHQKPYYFVDGIHLFNADSRVLIFE